MSVVRVEMEHGRRYEAVVDIDELIRELPDEWREFMRGDEPSDDDKIEFVKDAMAELGVDFFIPEFSPWVSEVRADDEWDYHVRPADHRVVTGGNDAD